MRGLSDTSSDDDEPAESREKSQERALRASRARTTAALMKAAQLEARVSALQAEVDQFKGSSDAATETRRLQLELGRRRLRTSEVEEENAKLREDIAQQRKSLRSLRQALHDMRDAQGRHGHTERKHLTTLRALVASLGRHVQRGYHAGPSFTARQLLEEMAEELNRLHRALAGEGDDALLPADKTTSKGRRTIAPNGAKRKMGGGSSGTAAGGPTERDNLEGEGAEAEDAGPTAHVAELCSRQDAEYGALRAELQAFRSQERPDASSSQPLQQATPATAAGAAAQRAAGGGAPAGLLAEYRLVLTKLRTKLQAVRERLRHEAAAVGRAQKQLEKAEQRRRELESRAEASEARAAAAEAQRARLEKAVRDTRAESELWRARAGDAQAAVDALKQALEAIRQHNGNGTFAPAARPAPPPQPRTPPPAPPPPPPPTAARQSFVAATPPSVPRATTEDMERELGQLDADIAGLSQTLEEAALAETRRILQQVMSSVGLQD